MIYPPITTKIPYTATFYFEEGKRSGEHQIEDVTFTLQDGVLIIWSLVDNDVYKRITHVKVDFANPGSLVVFGIENMYGVSYHQHILLQMKV